MSFTLYLEKKTNLYMSEDLLKKSVFIIENPLQFLQGPLGVRGPQLRNTDVKYLTSSFWAGGTGNHTLTTPTSASRIGMKTSYSTAFSQEILAPSSSPLTYIRSASIPNTGSDLKYLLEKLS